MSHVEHRKIFTKNVQEKNEKMTKTKATTTTTNNNNEGRNEGKMRKNKNRMHEKPKKIK